MIGTQIWNGGFSQLAIQGTADGIWECVFNRIFDDRVVCDATYMYLVQTNYTGIPARKKLLQSTVS